MPTIIHTSPDTHIRPILAAVRALGLPHPASTAAAGRHSPFVTISREAGAGGLTLAQGLVEYLSSLEPDSPPWTAWDRELAQRVAEEHHVNRTLVETLEERGQNWLSELLGGLSMSDAANEPGEWRVFWRTAATIRAIAQTGRCVIVGRGACFITSGMPGGVHVRLIAPLDYRITNYARMFNLTEAEATRRVRELDHNRQAFFRRYWPKRSLGPEAFTAVYNTAQIDGEHLVRSVAALLRSPAPTARQLPPHGDVAAQLG
jgi:hypothetical protein